MLTEREEEVYRLMASGLSNKDIASRLCISHRTVTTHIYNMYRKLEVSNSVQAILRYEELYGNRRRQMHGDDYQSECTRTWYQDNDWEKAMAHAALGIAGESGEVVEHIKKHLYHGQPLSAHALMLELGDLMYYLAMLAAEASIPLDMIMRSNIDKLMERYPNGWDK